jgi:ubiquinone/menaquinone biosynthesis C-methylase UbiE
VQKSIEFIGRDHAFFTRIKAELLVELARTYVGDPSTLKALDVGCGTGETDSLLVGELGMIEGVDVSEGVLETARARHPEVNYRRYDGRNLPYDAGSFDLAFAICVVHHVPPPQWQSFIGELGRVVRSGGLLVVIEHNPFNPLTRLAVSRCAFDDDAVLARRRGVERLVQNAGLEVRTSRYIEFFPWDHRLLRRAERALTDLPFGAQYAVAAAQP